MSHIRPGIARLYKCRQRHNRQRYTLDKTHGHITLLADEFSFIFPDREPIAIKNTNQYLRIADTIRNTGLPNYREARLPIKLGLNFKACEHHLRDYPDKRLIQYIKFGFPLSLQDSHELANTDIANYFSATRYPDQVSSYLDKEKSLGAKLGPLSSPPCDHFHCSPLLTRPKDGDKCRVILNLSYPKGNSINDHVDKQHFDHNKFILKFPTIDDIANETISIGKDTLLAKIDVAHAFRKLRVDPDNALKFGIKWQDQCFLDIGVVFGLVHGSSAFHMVSDGVTYVMAKRHHKIFTYIDDYIIVAHKNEAHKAFNDLFTLLEDLGLPIGMEKLHSPCRSLTCLGIVY